MTQSSSSSQRQSEIKQDETEDRERLNIGRKNLFVCQQSIHDRDSNKSFQASKPKKYFKHKKDRKNIICLCYSFYSPNTSTMRDNYINLGILYLLRKKTSLETCIEENRKFLPFSWVILAKEEEAKLNLYVAINC